MALLATEELLVIPRPGLEHRIQLTLEPGEALQLTGVSGSGKSTILRVLARLRAPEGGRLRLEGRLAEDIPAPIWRRKVAYIPQNPVMLAGTVGENLAAAFQSKYSDGSYNPAAARELLERVGLHQHYAQPAHQLSGGEAMRVALCRALLTEPLAILADEIFAPLDPAALDTTLALLAERLGSGASLVVVAHQLPPETLEGLAPRRLELHPTRGEP